jgi:hypothetical protein
MAIYLLFSAFTSRSTLLLANNTASVIVFINICMFVSEALNKTELDVYLTSGGVLVDNKQYPWQFIFFHTFSKSYYKRKAYLSSVLLQKAFRCKKNCIKTLSARRNISYTQLNTNIFSFLV